MADATLLMSQIKTLEAQLRVLYAQVKPSSELGCHHTLADLEGLMHGQVDHTAADIDAILYQRPPDMEGLNMDENL